MLKYLSKMAMDMLPSVAATIIGAYVVNHYIITRPTIPYASVAAPVSSADPRKADTRKADAKSDAKQATADVASLPEPGVKAKGISERAMLEKTAAERPATVEKPVEKPVAEKPAEKPADKPMETASIPVETRRHQPAPHEKPIVRVVPAPATSATPVTAPVVAAPSTAPAVEATIAPEDHRDANDLARAAIERLRGSGDGSPPHAQEAARTPDAPRVASAPPVVAAPAVRPLPPPIMVSTPGTESSDASSGSSQRPPYAEADPRRPVPPADIPLTAPSSSGPLDLRADASAAPVREHEHTSVAEDMLLAAKSVFHAVLPK
jgi:hypothetical protein